MRCEEIPATTVGLLPGCHTYAALVLSWPRLPSGNRLGMPIAVLQSKFCPTTLKFRLVST